jgi:MGT family glycosyltransferase
VYVTLGNIFNSQQRFEGFLTALIDDAIEFIVTVGRSLDPALFGEQPPNVHIERYIPQSMLLPYVDAVICHGGYNSVIGSLQAGRPLVVAPIAADQFVHAQRSAALGAAIQVSADPLQPATVRDAIHRVLHDGAYAAAAARIRDQIARLPDANAAAKIVLGAHR